MNVYHITIPGRVPSKKNGRLPISKRGRIPLPKAYILWERCAAPALMEFKNLNLELVEVQMEFYFPDNRAADLDNRITSVLDLLVKAKVIVNDSWQHVRNIYAVAGGIDRKKPRVEIWLKTMIL